MIESLVFYLFAALAAASGLMVVLSNSSVKSALFLVMAFVFTSVLWMLLEAEFLSLVLIFVYVGAVMTLFLFVVMMLNLSEEQKKARFTRLLPFGLVALAVVFGLMFLLVGPEHFGGANFPEPARQGADYSNVKELGSVLYTTFAYPFELCATLLLVAIISAISLAFRGKQHRRGQEVPEQIDINPEDRVRMVSMPPEKN